MPEVPLRSDGPAAFLAAGVEAASQTNKSYVMTLNSSHNRASGVVAAWAAAGDETVFDTVTLSTSDGSNAMLEYELVAGGAGEVLVVRVEGEIAFDNDDGSSEIGRVLAHLRLQT